MLIESNLIHDKITYLMNETEESQLNFSSYKAVISCLKQLKSAITELEAIQAENNAKHKYAQDLEGLQITGAI